jgi:hypothetical protein
MNFFNQIYNQLFAGNEKNKVLNIREVLKRNEQFWQEYQIWQNQLPHTQLIAAIRQAYFYKKTKIISPIQVHLFNSPTANGFALTQNSSFGNKGLQFLLEYWKNTILELNYFVQSAERQLIDQDTYVKTSEKYHLKPQIYAQAKQGEICNQQYGNILLEVEWIDNEPSYLKVMIMCYYDRKFTTPLDYNELIERLLQ